MLGVSYRAVLYYYFISRTLIEKDWYNCEVITQDLAGWQLTSRVGKVKMMICFVIVQRKLTQTDPINFGVYSQWLCPLSLSFSLRLSVFVSPGLFFSISLCFSFSLILLPFSVCLFLSFTVLFLSLYLSLFLSLSPSQVFYHVVCFSTFPST